MEGNHKVASFVSLLFEPVSIYPSLPSHTLISSEMFSITQCRNRTTSFVEVEIVPTKWIDFVRSTYRWPPKSFTSSKLIQEARKPPADCWATHPFDKILGVYEDYKTAREKLSKAEVTSNLESSSAEDTSGERRLRKRHGQTKRKSAAKQIRLVSASSLDPSSDDEISNSDDDQQLTPPQSTVFQSTSDDNEQNGPNGENLSSTIVSGSQAFCSNANLLPLNIASTSFQDKNDEAIEPGVGESLIVDNVENYRIIMNLPFNSDQLLQASSTIQPQVDENSHILAALNAIKESNQAFQSKVFKLLESQSQEILEVKAFLQNISVKSDAATKPDFTRIPKLPLTDDGTLRNMEDWLTLKANQDLLVSYLSLVGGSTAEKNIRRILERIFERDFRNQTNYTGKGNKTSFRNCKLFEVLKESVRTQKPLTQDDVIKERASNWFRYSKTATQQH